MISIRSIFLGIAIMLTACDTASTMHSRNNDLLAIQNAFDSLKRAVAEGRRDAVIRHLSPGTAQLFRRAQTFGINPDSTDEDNFSQLEVLIGLQARWLLGADALKDKSAADILEWGMQVGIVQLGGLINVDLSGIAIDGDTATAYMVSAGVTLTNAVLSFSKHRNRWVFDLDSLLLEPESTLASLRDSRSLSKIGMAILILEDIYNQPIPELRQYALPPHLRDIAHALQDAAEEEAYDVIIHALNEGRQKDAEILLDYLIQGGANNQRLLFTRAVCAQSRFNKRIASLLFRRVLNMNPSTLEGRFSRYMIDIEAGRLVDEAFSGLRYLIAENPSHPLLHWMLGVQSRDYYKRTRRTDRSAEGAKAFERVLDIFDVGPVLVHHTYANVLSEELGRGEEALVQRRIAVKLEPKAWTYQGLANTLSGMSLYDEANDVYRQLLEMSPNDADYWANWSHSLSRQRRWEECIVACQRVLELDPSHYSARTRWGYALEQLGRLKEALAKFEEAIHIHPVRPYAYDAAARVLTKMGQPDAAAQMLERKTLLHHSSQDALPYSANQGIEPAGDTRVGDLK